MTPEQIKQILDEVFPCYCGIKGSPPCARHMAEHKLECIAKAAYALAESEKDKEIAELRKEIEGLQQPHIFIFKSAK